MISRLAFQYRVTKPRVIDHNIKSFREFKKDVHEARRRAHMEAVAYQNKIEDQFLEKHKRDMRKQHFNNQCKFRSTIARNAYFLYEQTEKRKAAHQDHLDRLQKYVHDQEVKKLNRVRIKKILEYENENHWLQGENINEKFISQNILPEYVGSTEYYHKLHSEALAYDNLDFDLLHKVSSTEETVKQKNRMLIPIFKQFIASLRQVKFSAIEQEERSFEIRLSEAKRKNYSNKEEEQKVMRELKEEHERKMENLTMDLSKPAAKKQYIYEKVKGIVLMMKKWKEYTDVLSLTSAEILKIISDKNSEEAINFRKKSLQYETDNKKESSFIDPVEEDTQDEELTLEEYLVKQESKNPIEEASGNSNAELDSLLKDENDIFNDLLKKVESLEEDERKEDEVNLSKNLNDNMELVGGEKVEVDEGYLNASETTTSIEVLKEMYKSDPEVTKMLNYAGELTIEYPKLFAKIWQSQII